MRFFLLLILGFSLSVNADPKVVGGSLIDPKVGQAQAIHRVFFKLSSGTIGACTGASITANHVLTAAHCISDSAGKLLPIKSVAVELKSGQFASAVGLAVPPGYKEKFVNSKDVAGGSYIPNDVGVIAINTKYTGPLLSVSGRVPTVGQSIQIAGFGVSVPGKSSDLKLRAGLSNIKALSNKDPAIYSVYTGANAGICQGDSGGPTIAKFGNGPLVLAGVNSATLTPAGKKACSPGTIGVSTLVSSPVYLRFLKQVIGSSFVTK